MKTILGLLCLLFSFDAMAQSVATYIPKNAYEFVPMLRKEQLRYWPDHPQPETLAGLAEQESCISLTHSRCFKSTSQLKTQREEGAGVGQITRAYTKDGKLRFDTVDSLHTAYGADLKELNWNNIYTRPDLQARAIVLMSRDGARQFRYAGIAALDFGDAAYNSGAGNIIRDRRQCGVTPGCNPNVWFNNVEKTCSMSKKPIYGDRSACMINREHVHNVRLLRKDKYKKFFQ